jgi:hypothetical protein
MYYFKQEAPFRIPEQTKNSSAEIIQYALECICLANHSDEEKFEKFCKLVDTNIIPA